MTSLKVPSATAGPVDLADYLELRAFLAANRSSSLQDLIADIRRTGTSEELDQSEDDGNEAPGDPGSERSEACAQDAFEEIGDRLAACGQSDGYPFNLGTRHIQLQGDAEQAAYTFLLLLARFGLRAGPSNSHPERLFEDLCRNAAENYFGGVTAGGNAVHFGFPRRVLPRAFPHALRELLHALNDGLPNDDAPRMRDQKDAKLDLVAWRDFPDRRRGKLIGYGQCAVGLSDWREKLSELQPDSFNQKWLREAPAVRPTRLFFVPFRIGSDDWYHHSIDGGVLFDRCRIVALVSNLPEALLQDCRSWSSYVLRERLQ